MLTEVEQSKAKVKVVLLLVRKLDRVLQKLVVDDWVSLAETEEQLQTVDAVCWRCGLPTGHDPICQEADESATVGW